MGKTNLFIGIYDFVSIFLTGFPHLKSLFMSRWGNRVCAGCDEELPKDEFSRTQWRKGVGFSRCEECVREGVKIDDGGFGTMRYNNFTSVEIDMDEIFAHGSFKTCYLGEYTGGERTGQKCVAKCMHGTEGDYDYYNYDQEDVDDIFATDLDAVEQARRILVQWNNLEISNFMFRLNAPEVIQYEGTVFLLEPYIEDFIKFNSNTGWVRRGGRPGGLTELMQALSHYSYHVSSGQFLLCDLQGGVSRNRVTLTDPVIHSRHNRFGATDLGPDGMSSFFYYHKCNRFCRDSWSKPRNPRPIYRVTSHTSAA